MDRFETRELEYVVALADELSFTRAAERLGIAQPPLSRAIARLERRLGAVLFDRTSRRVTLTPAGELLVAEARAILSRMDGVADRIRLADRERPLVIAVRPATGSGLLAEILADWSGAEIRLHLGRQPADAVRAGAADLAVTCNTDDRAGLESVELVEQPTVALVSTRHALSAHDQLTTAQVRAADGFLPDCPDLPLDGIADLVLLQQAVVLVSRDAAARVGVADVRGLPVVDAPSTMLCFSWAPGPTRHPDLAAFVDRATQAARHPVVTGPPTSG
ncbi:LysR family transcriptional regulator [Kutzneria sp. CA-103260]|uniref:LysR family transcriptional regulator n=1 Tax=Kutzneria sp. CA-103260 TaxID=2802641 RepID=UPI001BA64AF2|nr:LysR family transcriptional regulator [Kutzneria sp. CA-103260]QUQ62635.1 LysR family transcriptional regulator [Kutzneria sp. CA-103260]